MSRSEEMDKPHSPGHLREMVFNVVTFPNLERTPSNNHEVVSTRITRPLPLLASALEVFGAPGNFGTVVPGHIYRAQFPAPENYHFLTTLRLKTVVTLVEGPYPAEYEAFLAAQGIRHVCIELPANKEVVRIEESVMKAVLEVVTHNENHPMLIHCNKGKHRTGCTVACLRLMYKVPIADVLMEYNKYAGLKARMLDEQFIQHFDISIVEGLVTDNIAPVIDLEPLATSSMSSPRSTRLRS